MIALCGHLAPIPSKRAFGCFAVDSEPGAQATGSPSHAPTHRPAFSLLELMIGIVILGLGMMAVATMFPVAWTRARTLNEYTVQKAAVEAADATVRSLVRVAPAFESSSFAGDLIFDPNDRGEVGPLDPLTGNGNWPSDTWVHALNMENVQVENRQFVDEDLWEVEQLLDLEVPLLAIPQEFIDRSYASRQLLFYQRLHPPMTRNRLNVVDDVFDDDDQQWDGWLDSHRFCWAVLHRLREQLVPPADVPTAQHSKTTRSLDLYYVTLRRPQSTNRYARQDPATGPDPYVLSTIPSVPAALPADQDVMFPIPWRVQVQFPGNLRVKDCLPGVPPPALDGPSGIPTEVEVPPPGITAPPPIKAMLVQMFSTGTIFIDEITGDVYRVTNRRLAGDNLDQAFLTLDREVFIEDLNLDPINGLPDPRCMGCAPFICANPAADAQELLRTVWVFPPSVQVAPAGGGGRLLLFSGSQPVVDINVRTMKLAPSE